MRKALNKQGTMTVTVPSTGRQLQVPRGLTGDALQRHVQAVLQAEATAAAEAEAAASAALVEKERQAVEELSLKQQLDAANRRAEAMAEELQQLKRATPEAAHMLIALQQASSQASQTLQALNRWDSRKGAEVSLVAEELQKRNAVIDEEVAARRLESHRLMNNLALAQGLPAPHPHLLEQEAEDAS